MEYYIIMSIILFFCFLGPILDWYYDDKPRCSECSADVDEFMIDFNSPMCEECFDTSYNEHIERA